LENIGADVPCRAGEIVLSTSGIMKQKPVAHDDAPRNICQLFADRHARRGTFRVPNGSRQREGVSQAFAATANASR
jgi:hypothetical protein